MSVEITIRVPDSLVPQVQQYRERLSEALALGLREFAAESFNEFRDENVVLALLARQPRPEEVLALRPSPEFQARVSDLLERSKQGQLSRAQEGELERALTVEHLVRLAKSHARHQLAR